MPARSLMGRRLPAVCLVVVSVAAGCGTTTPAPAPVGNGAAITQVLTFQAFDVVGLLPHLTPVTTLAGTCAGGSAVHAGRAGAWRCLGGDIAFDPCFANEAATLLACVVDPWATEVTLLRPANSLGRAGANRNDPGAPPWFVELEDGTRCGRSSGSTYRCATGGEIGPPDMTRPVWSVTAIAGTPVTAGVRTAWY